jgi:hypothetical protein
MTKNFTSLSQRLLSAVDLAVDFSTLGEYGLEPLTADGPCIERSGHRSDWEAFCRPSAARVPRGRARCTSPLRRRATA